MAATTINIDQPIRAILERWTRSTKASKRLSLRAAIILLAAANCSNAAISRQLGVVRNTVSKWRVRAAAAFAKWSEAPDNPDERPAELAARLATVLDDAHRSGHPTTFTAEQVTAFIAIACERPCEESGRPVSHWTAREIADEAVKRRIVESVSRRHMSRLLKGGPCARTDSATG